MDTQPNTEPDEGQGNLIRRSRKAGFATAYLDVIECHCISALAYRLHNALLWRSFIIGADGERNDAFPSYALLIAHLNCNKNTITALLKELHEAGLLEWKRRGHSSNLYTVWDGLADGHVCKDGYIPSDRANEQADQQRKEMQAHIIESKRENRVSQCTRKQDVETVNPSVLGNTNPSTVGNTNPSTLGRNQKNSKHKNEQINTTTPQAGEVAVVNEPTEQVAINPTNNIHPISQSSMQPTNGQLEKIESPALPPPLAAAPPADDDSGIDALMAWLMTKCNSKIRREMREAIGYERTQRGFTPFVVKKMREYVEWYISKHSCCPPPSSLLGAIERARAEEAKAAARPVNSLPRQQSTPRRMSDAADPSHPQHAVWLAMQAHKGVQA